MRISSPASLTNFAVREEVTLEMGQLPDGSPLLLSLTVLPGSASAGIPPLVELTDRQEAGEYVGEPVQVLESTEYRYTISSSDPGPIWIEPKEHFDPDDASKRSGRFRPRLSTGRLPIEIILGDRVIGRSAVEVRARKLNYLDEYRWMLRDIADISSEMILERFAASEQQLGIEGTEDAKTLYQRFAFLQNLLSDDEFASSLRQIVDRPYVQWQEIDEKRRIGEGVRLSSRSIRELIRPGARRRVYGLRLPSVPEWITVARTEQTLDNLPNRFVKFALQRWRALCSQVHDALLSEGASGPVERGVRESRSLLDQLDTLLAQQFFVEVGQLGYLPSENPVLRRREGYRDVYRAWILFEILAKLNWDGGDQVFGAGQRNVAALYEFWTFLQLAKIVSELVGVSFDPSDLIRPDKSGLGLTLRQGTAASVRGHVLQAGRRIDLQLWFNRTFSRAGVDDGSWSRPLRPDISLRIASQGDPVFTETWLHFDAKYRIDSIFDVEGAAPEQEVDEQRFAAGIEDEVSTQAKREDLLKMHAYKDAIRRSSGAYVVYPGDSNQKFAEFTEILPGLGAFGLRPSFHGPAIGQSTVRDFLHDVVNHAASQLTQHERLRYWVRESSSQEGSKESARRAATFLLRPAADTPVLLGYVRDAAHLQWVHEHLLYNLRAGERTGAVGLRSRELACEVLLLYSQEGIQSELWTIEGEPRLMTGEDMRRLGYPPRGDLYFCLSLGSRIGEAGGFRIASVPLTDFVARNRGSRPFGSPLVTDWLTLLRETMHPRT